MFCDRARIWPFGLLSDRECTKSPTKKQSRTTQSVFRLTERTLPFPLQDIQPKIKQEFDIRPQWIKFKPVTNQNKILRTLPSSINASHRNHNIHRSHKSVAESDWSTNLHNLLHRVSFESQCSSITINLWVTITAPLETTKSRPVMDKLLVRSNMRKLDQA